MSRVVVFLDTARYERVVLASAVLTLAIVALHTF